MSEFDTAYYVTKKHSQKSKYVTAKIGDTRYDSDNNTNYRCKADKKKLHGNSNSSSPGKEIEKNLMKNLANQEKKLF